VTEVGKKTTSATNMPVSLETRRSGDQEKIFPQSLTL